MKPNSGRRMSCDRSARVGALLMSVIALSAGEALAAPENRSAKDLVTERAAPNGFKPRFDTSYAPARPGEDLEADADEGPARASLKDETIEAARPADPVSGRACIDPRFEEASFAEEFDLPLDVSAWGPGTRWIAHTPWNGDFGQARFRDPGENSPFTVEYGILTIEASKDAKGQWGSGLLASVDRAGRGFSQAYGYFEARAKLPAVPGVWPAFWLIGLDRETKTAEIDVMEYRGAKPDGYTSSLHVWDRTGGPHDKQLERHVVFDRETRVDRFHTYGVHIGPERTTFFFNRCPVWTAETRSEHRQPMYVLINLALGGSFPIDETPNPTRMEVDWVRAWPIGQVADGAPAQ